MRDNLNQTIAEEQEAINQLEIANEKIEQRITLRDRVKAIFKKYGFTVLAVASAIPSTPRYNEIKTPKLIILKTNM